MDFGVIFCVLYFGAAVIGVIIAIIYSLFPQIEINALAKNNMKQHKFLNNGEFHDGWAIVKLEEDRFAYINKKGEYLNDKIFTAVSDFKNGVAIVADKRASALIDDSGRYIIPFNQDSKAQSTIKEIWPTIFLYSVIYPKTLSSEGREEHQIIRKDGTRVYPQSISSIEGINDDNIKFKSNGDIWIMDVSGRVISGPFDSKYNIGDGLYRVTLKSISRWGIYDETNGQIIIPCDYDSIYYFKLYSLFVLFPKDGSNNMRPFIVDKKNTIIVPQIYDEIRIIDRKYIQINVKNTGNGIINENGNILVQPKYSRIWPSKHGFMVTQNNKCGIVRNNGFSHLEYTIEKEVNSSMHNFLTEYTSPQYCQSILTFKPNYIIVTENGLLGVIDLDGNLILPIKYNSIDDCDGLNNVTSSFIIEKDGLFGVADVFGRITIPINCIKITKHRQNEKQFHSFGISWNDPNSSIVYEKQRDKFYKDKDVYFEVEDSLGNLSFLDKDGFPYDPNQEEKTTSRLYPFVAPKIPGRKSITSVALSDFDKNYLLFFDTETTGVPKYYNAPPSDTLNWPRLVQLSWILATDEGSIISRSDDIIRPDHFNIPIEATKVHGITDEKAKEEGIDIKKALELFLGAVSKSKCLIAHNVNYDMKVLGAELCRLNEPNVLMFERLFCTMKESLYLCAIPSHHGYKYPKLQELYHKLFGRYYSGEHNSSADTQATMECFFELKRRNLIADFDAKINPKVIKNSYYDHETKSSGWAVKNVRKFTSEERSMFSKAVVVTSDNGFCCCFFDKLGDIHFTPMYGEGPFMPGQDVDLSKAVIVTMQKDGEKDIERISLLKVERNA